MKAFMGLFTWSGDLDIIVIVCTKNKSSLKKRQSPTGKEDEDTSN